MNFFLSKLRKEKEALAVFIIWRKKEEKEGKKERREKGRKREELPFFLVRKGGCRECRKRKERKEFEKEK